MGVFGYLFGFGGLLGLLGLIAFIWMVYDILVNQKRMQTLHKVLWIVCGLIFGGLIPAIIYYFVVKK